MNNLEKQILSKINNLIVKEDIEVIRDLFKKNGKVKSFDKFNTSYGAELDMDVLQYVIHSNDIIAISQKELTYLLKKSDLKRYTQSGRYSKHVS